MPDVDAFIERWKASGASEQANYQLFLSELCEVLGVRRPQPATDRAASNTYCFERRVDQPSGTPGFIDLYKQDCFVLEAKQGSDAPEATEAEDLTGERLKRKMGTARRGTRGWELAMQRAKAQARRYARALPEEDGWPPFLVVVDVGFCLDLYTDFARQGKTYVQFPDPQGYRIELDDLRSEEVRETLRRLWTDPLELDPARRSARVTRELAEQLGRVAHSLETGGHDPDDVAQFLMRCLFSMFAEDVGLLPERSFTELLSEYGATWSFCPTRCNRCGSRWTRAASRGRSRRAFGSSTANCSQRPRRFPSRKRSVSYWNERRSRTGRTWSRPSSARSWSERWTRASGTAWARTTRPAPTSNASYSRRSSSRCGRNGKPPKPLPQAGRPRAKRTPSRKYALSTSGCARSRCWIRRAEAATFCT